MSLDPLHEWVARIVFDLPHAQYVAIAGGNAMLAHELVVRPTQDLDLFTPVASEVDPLVAALADELRARDAQVEIDRRGPGFSRLTVETVDGSQVVIEVAHDARLRDPVRLDFGRVLHPDEVAADKTLALFGRAAARDLVDVAALTKRYSLPQLCALATEKDVGFDPSVLADAITAAAAHPNKAFAELGLTEASTSRLRRDAQQWRATLLGADTENPPRPPLTPESSSRPRRPEHELPPHDQGREGPGLSP